MPNPDPTTFQPPPPLIKEEVFTDPLQKWYAPFTPEQSVALNGYPFLCELLISDPKKPIDSVKSCGGAFSVQSDGLHCEKCKNVQLWAWVIWRFRFIAYPDFTLQKPLQDRMDDYIERYVSPSSGALPAHLIPMGDGECRRAPVLEENIVTAIAMLETMQHPKDEADRWNFNTWAYFYLAAPNAFEEASTFCSEMIDEAKGKAGKNLPSPVTASVSGPSSNTDSSIPPLPITPSPIGETPANFSELSPLQSGPIEVNYPDLFRSSQQIE